MDGYFDQNAPNANSTDARHRRASNIAASIQFEQGTRLLRRRQFGDAEQCLREAIRFRPDYADALNNLGTAVWQQGRLSEAEEFYQRAILLNPNDFGILNNLGNILCDQRRFDEASRYYRLALRHQPNSAEARMNLGVLLSDQGEYDEAIASIQESLRLRPDSHVALDNLGAIFARQGKWDDALALHEQALRQKPDYPEAHRNRSFVWLAQGDFERGWPEYEWRLRCRKHRGPIFRGPRWTGDDLAGKTILLYAEQGLGDTLQFIRFAAQVKDRGEPRILFQSPPALAKLIASCPAVDRILSGESEIADFDVQTSLMSLPALLGTTLATLPGTVPYLSTDRDAVEKWRPVVAETISTGPDCPKPRLKIGVAWQGNPLNRVDRWRSYPLAKLAALAGLEGVRLISLQTGDGTDQISRLAGQFSVLEPIRGVQRLDDDRDFRDTAAIMSQLDLVVTPDTAVAHLAGSLGVPVWVALSHIAEWRWELDRDSSPWYPTMRLFRQAKPGDWDDVFGRMATILKRQMSTPRALVNEQFGAI